MVPGPGVASLFPASEAAGLEVVSLFPAFEVAEPGAVFVVAVSGIVGPRASADIPVAFAVSVPAFEAVVEVDSPARPTFVLFPNAEFYTSSASSSEVAADRFVHNTKDVRTNCVRCSTLSLGSTS